MTFEPGILFWVGALLSLVSAVLAVKLDNPVQSVAALMVLILSVIVILFGQGAVGIGVVAFLLLGPVSLSFLFVALAGRKLSQPIRLSLSRYSRVYLFAASIIFLANLYLVASTGIWQYAWEINNLSFGGTLELIAESYFLPILSLLSFILLLAIWAVTLKRRELS